MYYLYKVEILGYQITNSAICIFFHTSMCRLTIVVESMGILVTYHKSYCSILEKTAIKCTYMFNRMSGKW